MLKAIWNEIELELILRECGIFITSLYVILLVVVSVLALPILPFYAFNEWSKGWFAAKKDS